MSGDDGIVPARMAAGGCLRQAPGAPDQNRLPDQNRSPVGGSALAVLTLAVFAMALVVTASNVLVQYPLSGGLSDLTWGALTYPFAFLVTDLANRRLGPAKARRVVLAGFVVAVIASIWLATPRIAIASGTAFLVAQLTDVAIFQRLRAWRWWVAPLVSTVIGSSLDTALFFGIAFSCGPLPLAGVSIDALLSQIGLGEGCTPLPWVRMAFADLGVKLALAGLALVPYGLMTRQWSRLPSQSL